MTSTPHVLVSCGSYNPITIMHLRMFELAKHHLKEKKNIQIEKGVISPTNDAYALIKPSLSPAKHRLAMINLALKDVESQWIVCNDWETKQKDWVRTLPALRYYSTIYGANMKLLCGADLLESFLIPNLWSDDHIEEILRSFGVVVLPRSGSNPYKLIYNSLKSEIFQRNLSQIDILDDSLAFDLSSTKVRDSVKEGRPIDQLVHRKVAEYIKNQSLYKIFTSMLSASILSELRANESEIGLGHITLNRERLVALFKANPRLASAANYEKLCKIDENIYAICPQFCCGEFWEGSPLFCCSNNFVPIRHLWVFLIVSFIGTFATIVVWLIIEKNITTKVQCRLDLLKLQNPTIPMGTMDRSSVSEFPGSTDTSVDDESSDLSEYMQKMKETLTKNDYQALQRHSANFKNMSKLSNSATKSNNPSKK